MKITMSVCAVGLSVVLTSGLATAQLDEGDIGLSIEGGRIVTNLLEEHEKEAPRGVEFVEQRLFVGELGVVEFEAAKPGDPGSGGGDVFQDVLPGVSGFSTNTPGFDSGPGVFSASASVGFSVLNGLQVFDPQSGVFISAGLAEADPALGGSGTRGGSVTETMAVEFNEIAFQTDAAPDVFLPRSLVTPLDGLPVFSNGRFHRHWNFTILPVDDPNAANPAPLADPGVYALELVMTTTEMGVDDSLPFIILFPYAVDEESDEFADAIAAANARLGLDAAPGCSAADLAAPFGTLDIADVVRFLQVFGAGCP
ncbi:MAG: hypothetical protein CMJ31_00020 [Phycisphaerae bacterium]|nr:hypothetical protein [Phycisphaerae bacterium]|tara:strand:- start:39 stop:971 length:933 start_codon:yes stop_codon:yes gene_type:complete